MKMQFKFRDWQFESTWYATLLMLLCVMGFIKLGLWQYHKAMHKQAIEETYRLSKTKHMVDLRDYMEAPQQLEFQQVTLEGQYLTDYQILIDNQIEDNQAGFHVITPFKIKGSETYVLVNRGWVRGFDNHAQLPVIETPAYEHALTGMVWVPTTKIFTLEKPVADGPAKLEAVWQHLDMQKYQKMVPLQVLSIIIKLAPEQQEGGFVRRWQLPPSRIATNLSYAYQWFGFAFAAMAIYGYLGFRKEEKASHAN